MKITEGNFHINPYRKITEGGVLNNECYDIENTGKYLLFLLIKILIK